MKQSHSKGESNLDHVTVLLHEYDALVAENRIYLESTDRKLSIGMAIASAIVGAGFLSSSPVYFLALPFFVLFLALFVVAQTAGIVLVASQLAVLEKRINLIAGATLLTYFSSTVPKTCDVVRCYDLGTGRHWISFNFFYLLAAFLLLFLLCAYSLFRSLSVLLASGMWSILLYSGTFVFCLAAIIFLGIRAATNKRRFIRLIEHHRIQLDRDAEQRASPGKE